MKITKFPQSCILIESNDTRLLIDPGKVKFEEKFIDYWKSADAILVTHRHGDHYFKDKVKSLNIPIYSTSEVQNFDDSVKIDIIKQGDEFKIKNLKITVTKAIHGYIYEEADIKENVGYIVDDGKTKLYITSDTIRFKTEVMADAIFIDVTAYDASMSLWGASQTYFDVGAKLMIVAHQDEGKILYEKSQVESYLSSRNVNFIIPEIMQSFEI